jgi:NADPH:quinone reductase-like Zn-dependent oxidoreductase
LRPVIDSRFELQDINNAFRHYDSQTHFGKVCLEL